MHEKQCDVTINLLEESNNKLHANFMNSFVTF